MQKLIIFLLEQVEQAREESRDDRVDGIPICSLYLTQHCHLYPSNSSKDARDPEDVAR